MICALLAVADLSEFAVDCAAVSSDVSQLSARCFGDLCLQLVETDFTVIRPHPEHRFPAPSSKGRMS